MRRAWIFLLLVAGAGAQESSGTELDVLVAEWRHPRKELRERIDAELRAMGPVAVPEVAKALKSQEPLVRKRAGEFLEVVARVPPAAPLDPALEDSFIELLDHEDPRVRRAAARTLASRGGAVVPKLVPLLGGKSSRGRHGAALTLLFIEPPPEDAFAALLAATADSDASVREQALAALALRVATVTETLTAADADVLGRLVVALGDRSEAVVSVAVAALARRGPASVGRLVAVWDDDALAPNANEVLVQLGDAAIGPASEALSSGSAKRKRRAAECLGRIVAVRDVPVDPVLAPALADPDAEVRLAAAEAFGIAVPVVANRALAALLVAAKDPDARVRLAALAAASRGASQDPKVIALLRAAKSDPDPAVKLVAAGVGAKSLDECAAVAKSPAAPVATRLLAAERLLDMPGRPGSALEALGRVVADRGLPPDVRAAGAEALAAIAGRRLFELRYAPREDAATKGFRAAADKGLAWLALAQKTRDRGGDGRWACDGIYRDNHDVGVTGLALLTFLAAGQTDRPPAIHAKSVRQGIEWILSRQAPEGLIREGAGHDHTLLEHAIATHALCELVGMTGDDTCRPQAQKAIDCCAAVRSSVGWKYVARGDKNDTNVTTWMAVALAVADQTAFKADPDALEGAREWIWTMTDPNFGGVGYDYPGGAPSRPEGLHDRFPPEKTASMVACGIVCRIFLGEEATTSEMIHKGSEWCLEIPPKWDPEDGSIDMYYWYYGSLAMFQVSDLAWTKWVRSLRGALLPKQEGGGSWKPVDVWGNSGGSVYATSMCTLALLTPWRYPRGVMGSKPPAAYAPAVAALKEASASPCERLRVAAARALSRCPGGR